MTFSVRLPGLGDAGNPAAAGAKQEQAAAIGERCLISELFPIVRRSFEHAGAEPSHKIPVKAGTSLAKLAAWTYTCTTTLTAGPSLSPRSTPSGSTMYVCGPTVYNYVHIGNARGPVVFDVLAKLLRRRYPKLVYARNITDVDDKINAAAKELGVPITHDHRQVHRHLSRRHGRAGREPRPDIEPHATAHIPQIIAMIEQLIDNGHAYAAEGHVLFAVASFADYGKLSRRRLDEMLAGARVEVAPYKRDAGRFRAVEAVHRPTCPAGTRPGASAGPAGTSNARR